MTLLNHQLELLAPARTADIAIEAINHGADAVYLGGPDFGARVNASNTLSDIERVCQHAHRFNSRVFVTLNTILRDDELEPARRMVWDVYHAGADALIVQDMGLLMLDLPPIQLHASTQTDIRTPEKARFLQDAGFSQIVLARELTLEQIAAIHAALDTQRCQLEFFVHGALCVAYSGQCYISHAHTGRSANRGDCSQACRLPYHVLDAQGRYVAHHQHVLSMKDNNQSANLAALVRAGVRSFKIEGRYKDMAYVKNITAHYRLLLDELIASSQHSNDVHPVPLSRASSGRTTFSFTPDPDQNFNREFTDYFVNGRQQDIGAFDSPKNPGQAVAWVRQIGEQWFELETLTPETVLHNGDGLCYYNLQKELVGTAINRVDKITPSIWRVYPKDPIQNLSDLRKGLEVNRNRDMSWIRALEKKSSERRIGVWLRLDIQTSDASEHHLSLHVTDEEGCATHSTLTVSLEPARDPEQSRNTVHAQLSKLGGTIFELHALSLPDTVNVFIPTATLNALRRDALEKLEQVRQQVYQRPARALPVEPFVSYPEDSLSYLANVYNHQAAEFYARHGVRVIEAAYESHEETGEVSLMITKHCVRYSLSLCPKQAKGVTGVQGTVRAEPLTLLNGSERLTLRFDCKPCEMHVVGKIKKSVMRSQPQPAHLPHEESVPIRFYKTRP